MNFLLFSDSPGSCPECLSFGIAEFYLFRLLRLLELLDSRKSDFSEEFQQLPARETLERLKFYLAFMIRFSRDPNY